MPLSSAVCCLLDIERNHFPLVTFAPIISSEESLKQEKSLKAGDLHGGQEKSLKAGIYMVGGGGDWLVLEVE